jgi:hypothetical protein
LRRSLGALGARGADLATIVFRLGSDRQFAANSPRQAAISGFNAAMWSPIAEAEAFDLAAQGLQCPSRKIAAARLTENAAKKGQYAAPDSIVPKLSR